MTNDENRVELNTPITSNQTFITPTTPFKLRGHTIEVPYVFGPNYMDYVLTFALLEIGGLDALKSLSDNKVSFSPDILSAIENALGVD